MAEDTQGFRAFWPGSETLMCVNGSIPHRTDNSQSPETTVAHSVPVLGLLLRGMGGVIDDGPV